MIKDLRTLSHQLANPGFDSPKELFSWMGAIQAQDYNMSKWAIGIRLKSATIETVNRALRQGEILRTHIMRPTGHNVAAEDIRWMLKLSASRIRSANDSYAKGRDLEITEQTYTKAHRLLEKILEGNKSLTKQEIEQEFSKAGLPADDHRMTRFMLHAETEGIVCSGQDKGNKPTYALLEERVPPVKELHKEEALAKLATSYFRSHSPASLEDFTWWSGLSISEARQAVGLIRPDLFTDKSLPETLFIHKSANIDTKADNILHFLPSFDEYLISYKDRTAVLDPEHSPKAFNRFGTFYPVIMHEGKIAGNWNKSVKKTSINIETSFFNTKSIDKKLIEAAGNKYKEFMGV